MCSDGKQVQEVFCTNDGVEQGLDVPVDGGEEAVTACFQQSCAGLDGAFRVWDMLKQFHACDEIIGVGLFTGQVFCGNQPVVNRKVRMLRVRLGGIYGICGEVDAGDVSSRFCQCLREDAAPTSDIKYLFAFEGGNAFNP